eukprot:scaffold273891_cov25-Prasinocladus_malaysianus.AAC.1
MHTFAGFAQCSMLGLRNLWMRNCSTSIAQRQTLGELHKKEAKSSFLTLIAAYAQPLIIDCNHDIEANGNADIHI